MKNIKLSHLGCMLSAGVLFYSCKKSEPKVQLGQGEQAIAKTAVSQGSLSGNFYVLGTKNPNVTVEISKDLANFATHPLGYLHVFTSGGLKNMGFSEWEDIVAAGYTNYSASVPTEIRMHPNIGILQDWVCRNLETTTIQLAQVCLAHSVAWAN